MWKDAAADPEYEDFISRRGGIVNIQSKYKGLPKELEKEYVTSFLHFGQQM